MAPYDMASACDWTATTTPPGGRPGDGRRLPPRLPLLSDAADYSALDLYLDMTLDCVREQCSWPRWRGGDRIGGARPSADARRDNSRADRSAQPAGAIFHSAARTTRRQPIACAGPHAVGATSTVTMESVDDTTTRTGHQTIRPELQWLSRQGKGETHERARRRDAQRVRGSDCAR
jgi:hypothetical protein